MNRKSKSNSAINGYISKMLIWTIFVISTVYSNNYASELKQNGHGKEKKNTMTRAIIVMDSLVRTKFNKGEIVHISENNHHFYRVERIHWKDTGLDSKQDG